MVLKLIAAASSAARAPVPDRFAIDLRTAAVRESISSMHLPRESRKSQLAPLRCIVPSLMTTSASIRPLRAVARMLLMMAITAVLYAVYGLLLIVLPRRARRSWRFAIMRRWARLLARTVGLRVEVEGEAPAGGFFLVSNHLSYLDVILLSSLTDVSFVAKAEVASWPLAGRLATSFGTIYVDRTSRRDAVRVMTRMRDAVRNGNGVVLFAEGTTSDGTVLLPFRSSLLEVVTGSGQPVYFAAIRYATAPGESPARESVCWWGDAPLLRHFWRLLQVHSLHASVTFGGPVTAKDRKLLAQELWSRVNRALFDDIRPSHETGEEGSEVLPSERVELS
jgi:1-acyl-sn-glycerol-3-phosphate acyltransferase